MAFYNAPLNAPRDPWYQTPLVSRPPTTWGNATDISPLPWQLGPNSQFGGAPGALSATPAVSANPFGSLPYNPMTSSPGATAPGGATSTTSTNPFTTLRNVKSEGIQKSQDALLKSYDSIAGSTAVDDYLARFLKEEPKVGARYDQELGTLDDVFSGANLRRQLGDVDKRKTAVSAYLDLVGKQIEGRTNSMQAVRGGGLGGWQNRFMAGESEKVGIPLELQNVDLARAYADADDATKLSLLGKTAALVDSNTRRALVPLQTQQQNLGANEALLGPINALDKSNMFYGVQSPYDAMSPSYGVPSYVSPYRNSLPLPRGGNGQPSIMPISGGDGYSPMSGGYGGGAGAGGNYIENGIVYTDRSKSRINYEATNAIKFAGQNAGGGGGGGYAGPTPYIPNSGGGPGYYPYNPGLNPSGYDPIPDFSNATTSPLGDYNPSDFEGIYG